VLGIKQMLHYQICTIDRLALVCNVSYKSDQHKGTQMADGQHCPQTKIKATRSCTLVASEGTYKSCAVA
jgi:hypothetical protein